eukprot:1556625-Amphidinium_carterae.2
MTSDPLSKRRNAITVKTSQQCRQCQNFSAMPLMPKLLSNATDAKTSQQCQNFSAMPHIATVLSCWPLPSFNNPMHRTLTSVDCC